MPTLTYVFDPYDPQSAAGAEVVLELWHTHRTRLRFETVHAGAHSAWLGLGPDSERSARVFCALRSAAPAQEVPIMHALHRARDERLGRRLVNELAQGAGIDPASVFAQLRRDRARAELERGRALQLGQGPTLLFTQDHVVTSVPLDATIAPMLMEAVA